MSNSTSGFVDPHKMAQSEQSLSDKVAIAYFSRATKLLTSDLGELQYHLGFAIDTEGYCVISGKLDTMLTMRCQRCVRDFQAKIASDFVVSPVKNDEEAKALPAAYEAVYTADGKLYPMELIEDELILALPIVPLHELGSTACVAVSATTEQGAEGKFQNPFQVLQNMNVNKKSQQAEDK